MHLVTGGSASGKSAYAEQQVLELSAEQRRLETSFAYTETFPRRYYLATMRPWGDEGKQRVEKHQKMRQEKGFTTIECYHSLEALELPEHHSTLLLECLSNLLANEQFEIGGTDQEICDRIERGILHLQKQTEHLIIVTNEVFSDGVSYEDETERFIRLLGAMNVRLASLADRVTEVVYGIPVPVKPVRNLTEK